ncbi:hypothetical protein ACLB2K_007983 [Fragaria x ananassa]
MAGKHIPEDIIVDILSRLPIKSLIRGRCVSKRWGSIVSDPQFAKVQFKVASQQKPSSRRLLLCNVYQTESIDLETRLCSGANFWGSKLTLPFKKPKYNDKRALGSCDGLVCLSTITSTELYIWNPSTGFLHKLPNPEFSGKMDYVFYSGFGHLSVFGKGLIPLSLELDLLSYQKDALLRETLHWICDYSLRPKLLAFDSVKEEFRELPLPNNFDQELGLYDKLVCDSWGGWLHVFRYPFFTTSYVELRVMREYGLSGSWTKLFNVKLTFPPEHMVVLFPFLAMETSTFVAKFTLNSVTDSRMEMMRIEHKGEPLVMVKEKEEDTTQNPIDGPVYAEEYASVCSVSDPQFAKLQFKVACEQKSLSRRLLFIRNDSEFESLDLETPWNGDKPSIRKLTAALDLPEWSRLHADVLGSCNGLASVATRNIWDPSNGVIQCYIWNPSTGFSHTLPRPGLSYISYSGFGYLPATDDYKVLVAESNGHSEKPVPVERNFNLVRGPGIFAFDFEEEKFREMPQPTLHQDDDKILLHGLDSCGGCLYGFFFRNGDLGCVELWIMREYGLFLPPFSSQILWIEMASNGNGNGEFSFNNGPAAVANGNGTARNGLAKIQTKKNGNGMCHDDSSAPVKAQTIDQLHSLQKKKSAPTTPIKGTQGAFAVALSEEERQKQQLQSISNSLASLTRETGPKVVRGDPANQSETPKVSSHVEHHHHFTPTISVSDSALKFTHVLYNLSPAELYEQAIKYEKGSFITSTGALATLSGAKTGRSPRDKRVVKDETTEKELWWGRGSPNIEMDEHTFMVNRERAVDYLNSLDKVFVNDQFLNWDPENRIKVRIVSARAYHSLFMHNMCIRPSPEELENFGTPDFTIYNAGQFPCNRYTHYMTSSTSIDLNLGRREMVILGTMYAGEMKKGLFSVMHYLMPKRQILSLHSGCNMGKDGDVALFFGLSGTGKTTLSTDHNRYLIGDDEHCWTENGVSNIEGGCYAKCIDLAREKEPDIWNAIKFGAVLENIVFDEHTREVDYSDKSVTENTRAAYPIEYIPNAKIPCVGPHPKNVILLACDAFGVLPPVSKLNLAQTMYHFISGYTALVAGTEEGVKEPQATFSACFGAAFIMLHPTKYAAMLAQKMQQHGATGWLVNTGWSGGRYGSGKRIKLPYTRKIIDAIHSGSLLNANYKKTEVFGLEIPTEIEGVPSEILDPVNTWSDKKAYQETLLKLAGLFKNNFETFTNYKIGKDNKLTEDILAAGPNF